MTAGLRILIERLKLDDPNPSTIIDTIQPIYARIEMMMTLFMLPVAGVNAIHCSVELEEPVLPEQFGDLQEAQRAWCTVCCWRYCKQAREEPWNQDATCFKTIRALLLKWNTLLMTYTGRAALGSPYELQRAIAMISQFRLLFVAFMFSVRKDLHLPDQVRPSFVNLLVPGEVSFTYHLPQRVLMMIPELNWETAGDEGDLLKIRLFPRVDTVRRSATAGVIRMTLKP